MLIKIHHHLFPSRCFKYRVIFRQAVILLSLPKETDRNNHDIRQSGGKKVQLQLITSIFIFHPEEDENALNPLATATRHALQ